MRARAIAHQQICQLRWHLLACLGLIMVLPIEEAAVNMHAGAGFHSIGMAVVAIMFSPLLAGLIACANVQGDLSERRYIFWRSKPANVKKLMTLKFFVGLTISLAIIVCPIIFAVVSSALCGKELDDPPLKYYVPVPIIIAVMTYSLCFGTNVLVRNTARSWLIGMLLAGLVLVVPFMLPLGFTDMVSDVEMWAFGFYPAIMLVTSVAAFVFALYAAQRDWHLKTNLKGLLCVGAGLVFLLLVLFSSQIANIRVLDEREIEHKSGWRPFSLDKVEGKPIVEGRSYVNLDDSNISLQRFMDETHPAITNRLSRRKGDTYCRPYPRAGGVYKKVGNDLYALVIHSYHHREKKTNVYDGVYLRSYKLTSGSWKQASELDLSDCLEDGALRTAMRLIDNTLVVCIRDSLVVLDVTNPAEPKQIDKKLNVLGGNRSLVYEDRQKEMAIPLVPIDEISMEERIRLSIDLMYRSNYSDNDIYESSIVDVQDGKFALFSASGRDVARFDVIRRGQENIYCRFGASRPFTILESLSGQWYDEYSALVEDGKLYCRRRNTLLVFDVRSGRRIRKIGHFVRMDCHIDDMSILDDSNILLSARWYVSSGGGRSRKQKKFLYLLKNPE